MSNDVLQELYNTVLERKNNPAEGSYTCYLFDKGLDKILKKCGEECSETIIAAKNNDNKETVLEISDLMYHIMVMMVNQGIQLEDVLAELDKRSNKTGNLKTFHQVDKNSWFCEVYYILGENDFDFTSNSFYSFNPSSNYL